MAKKIKVSIIITSYNNREYIEEAIRSAVNQQTDDINIEIIVVDDCSPDGSFGLLKNLEADYGFKLLQTKKNSGPSHVRNLGIATARGEFISFLDGDDYLLDGKVAAEVEYFKDHVDVDIAYCDSYNEYGGKIDYANPASREWEMLEGDVYNRLIEKGNIFLLHTPLVPARIMKRYKFNESLQTFAEDYELWLRIAADGHTFGFVDKPLVVYRKHRQGLSKPRVDAYESLISILKSQEPTLSRKGRLELINIPLGNAYRLLACQYVLAGKYSQALEAIATSRTYTPTGGVVHLLEIILKLRLNYLAKLYLLFFRKRIGLVQ